MYSTVLILRSIIYGAAGKGANLESLCDAIGITPADLHNAEKKIEGVDAVSRMWDAILEQTTKADQFVSSSGIGKLEEILNPEVFIRVHRSTIVNVNYLKEIERHFNGGMVVKMQSGKSFPVSRTYAKLIRKKVV